MVSPLDLPAPNVSISFSGVSAAGLVYSMNCSAIVVDGLVVLPDLMIVFPNSTAISASSLVYTFSPLRTSDGGQYTCTATVNIPEPGIIDLQASKTDTITVESQYFIIDSTNCLMLSFPSQSQCLMSASLVSWCIQWTSHHPLHCILGQCLLSLV